MKNSVGSSGVSRPSADKTPKDKKFQSSKLVSKQKSPSSSVVPRPKNHLAWHVALNPTPSKEKTLPIPQVKWSCPPKINLNPNWDIAEGEESKEKEVQSNRERVPGLCILPEPENEPLDDSKTPIIPTIAVEEAAEAAEQIDSNLLVHFLANPEMVKKLIQENRLSSSSGHGTAPTATKPALVDNPVSECSESIHFGRGPVVTNEPVSLPSTIVETTNESSNEIRATHAARAPVTARVELARPFLPTALTSWENTMKRSVGQYGLRDINYGVGLEEPVNPYTSKPSEEEIEELIIKYGGGTTKHVTSPLTGMQRTLNRFGVSEHHQRGLNHSSVSGHYQWGLNHSLPQTQTAPAFPSAWEPRFVSPGTSHFPSFPPTINSGHSMTFDYNMSRHGHHETWKHSLLNPVLPENYLQRPEPTYKRKTNEMQSAKYQKPCKYFNTSRGCRNGSKCLYQHSAPEWRAGGAAAKRLNFGMDMG